jgi:YVTN family beta-propeller protein
VTNPGYHTVSVIDTRTNTVTATIDVGLNPQAVAVESTTGSVFVVNEADDTVSVLTAP